MFLRMFHVAADDSGSSAVWVAKRVPDDHITAVANQFTIGEIDISDKDNYLGTFPALIISNLIQYSLSKRYRGRRS